jgi:hypothetical protein
MAPRHFSIANALKARFPDELVREIAVFTPYLARPWDVDAPWCLLGMLLGASTPRSGQPDQEIIFLCEDDEDSANEISPTIQFMSPKGDTNEA